MRCIICGTEIHDQIHYWDFEGFLYCNPCYKSGKRPPIEGRTDIKEEEN